MEREGGKSEVILTIVTEPQFTQHCREYLEKQQLLDKRHRVKQLPDGTMALPIVGETLSEQHLLALRQQGTPQNTCRLVRILNPIPSKKAQRCPPAQKLCQELRCLVESRGHTWSTELEKDLPRSWQRHGDLLLFSEDSFKDPHWKKLEPGLWKTVASVLGAQRLAKRGRVSPGGTRTPKVILMLGDHGWVEHVDNGIRYTFDVTQSMFSFGNITEKLRVASMSCAGEVLVDLYAGIGYFTLPFLIHANAAFVHACEWDPHAAAALRKNLELNGVSDRCCIHLGDNRKLKLQSIANRVNLGLIPTSEEGWPTACQVLRQDTGGILHIHQNVESFPGKDLQLPSSSEAGEKLQIAARNSGRQTLAKVPKLEWRKWAEVVAVRIRDLLLQLHGKPWETQILHIQPVKSYAPHVDHIVLDLDCRPLSSSGKGVEKAEKSCN
ncbi:tRNA wybutosine-synthesizing protein 2 homolog [Gracilinanus agilis]|uniref:tRNA wybutosine-synthesizing protein 2 homolog n=1 Tax=Gracilinanus agilis TaxID=191870 RepID=UPI001CFD8606|nr:tRNA wybutosine-synthesizing protein 2 homolog [Gracilinanus agilis]